MAGGWKKLTHQPGSPINTSHKRSKHCIKLGDYGRSVSQTL